MTSALGASELTAAAKPTALRVVLDNIPVVLRAIDQWVTWRYETSKDGKWTKVPYTEENTLASSTNRQTWASVFRVEDAYQAGCFDGIGFVVTAESGIIGIDLDHCIDPQTYATDAWALEIIDHFNSYTEASPSGTGVRIFLAGQLPAGGRKKGNIEVYSTGRYLTVTGQVLKSCQFRNVEPRQKEIDAFMARYFPADPKSERAAAGGDNASIRLADHEILDLAKGAKNGAKVTALLNGDVSSYPSQSEAELALCCLLAFYTQDGAQLDRIFRGSGLVRDKWDEKHGVDTYGARTIEKAISGTTERYSGKPEKRSEFDSAPKEIKRAETNYEIQKWVDFVATDHGSAPFTVDGIAPDSGVGAVHGRGKGGKTTLLIHGARSIASGQPFLDRATVQKPVLYLNYEMGFSYLKELLSAGGPCPDEAYILNRPEPVLQISTVEALMQQIGKPGVMVIDSFRGAFRLAGDAENSAGGAGLILRNLQDLSVKHKWLVIVVHHSNRSQREGTDGVSGTSDWIAAPDVIWTWSRPDKTKPGVLHIEGRMPPVEPLAVDLSPEACLFVGSVEESQRETDNKAILNAVTEEGQSADVIAEMIGRPAGTVRKRLETLFECRKLNRSGEGKRGDPHLYSKVSFRTENLLGAETNLAGAMAGQEGWSKAR